MLVLVVVLMVGVGALGARAQECRPYWASGGPPPGSYILFGRTFNDGSGPALFAIWGEGQRRVWRLQQGQWSLIETGLPTVWGTYSFHILDDGTGPALCLFGYGPGPNGRIEWVVRWTGSGWEEPWPGIATANTWPVLSADLGSGPVIYGVTHSPPRGVVRWNGAAWERMGTDVFGPSVINLTAFDDGTGTTLYAGGNYNWLNGEFMGGFTKWDGSRWVAIGNSSWMDGRRFITYDSGSGPTLYMYGTVGFQSAPQIVGLLKFDGQVWTPAGGIGGFSVINDMTLFDDGRGQALYVGGGFTAMGGVPAQNIARFDGQNWEPLGAGMLNGGVRVLAPVPTARGPALLALGEFTHAGGGASPTTALWVGCPNCYADCDLSGKLNVNDFICFINKYAVRAPEANCTVDGVIDVADFVCFMGEFGRGCP